MGTVFIHYRDPNGVPVHDAWDTGDDGKRKPPKGATIIPRLPKEPGEEWTGIGFAIPPEKAKLVADALAGSTHIAEARLQKRIEAILIKSGIPLGTGLLVAEAQLRKVEPGDLANIVLEKAAAFAAIEVDRQAVELEAVPDATEVVAIGAGAEDALSADAGDAAAQAGSIAAGESDGALAPPKPDIQS